MLTVRIADKKDINYCYNLIISEVEHGHFDKKLNSFLGRFFFRRNLRNAITGKLYKAVDGHRACFFYISENGNEKIGFSSVIEHSPVTFEIWLMVIEKQYRRNGYGKIIVKNIIKKHIIPFTENLFFVRTYKSSTTMISLLNNLKFRSHTNEGADNVIFTKIYSEKDLQ